MSIKRRKAELKKSRDPRSSGKRINSLPSFSFKSNKGGQGSNKCLMPPERVKTLLQQDSFSFKVERINQEEPCSYLHFRDFLIECLDSKKYVCLGWVDRETGMFYVKWKRCYLQTLSLENVDVFVSWAAHKDILDGKVPKNLKHAFKQNLIHLEKIGKLMQVATFKNHDNEYWQFIDHERYRFQLPQQNIQLLQRYILQKDKQLYREPVKTYHIRQISEGVYQFVSNCYLNNVLYDSKKGIFRKHKLLSDVNQHEQIYFETDEYLQQARDENIQCNNLALGVNILSDERNPMQNQMLTEPCRLIPSPENDYETNFFEDYFDQLNPSFSKSCSKPDLRDFDGFSHSFPDDSNTLREYVHQSTGNGKPRLVNMDRFMSTIDFNEMDISINGNMQYGLSDCAMISNESKNQRGLQVLEDNRLLNRQNTPVCNSFEQSSTDAYHSNYFIQQKSNNTRECFSSNLADINKFDYEESSFRTHFSLMEQFVSDMDMVNPSHQMSERSCQSPSENYAIDYFPSPEHNCFPFLEKTPSLELFE